MATTATQIVTSTFNFLNKHLRISEKLESVFSGSIGSGGQFNSGGQLEYKDRRKPLPPFVLAYATGFDAGSLGQGLSPMVGVDLQFLTSIGYYVPTGYREGVSKRKFFNVDIISVFPIFAGVRIFVLVDKVRARSKQ